MLGFVEISDGRVVKMFCYNRSNEKSNWSGLGSDQGQIPGRGPRGAKLTNQKVILTDDFDRQLVNFEIPGNDNSCQILYKYI